MARKVSKGKKPTETMRQRQQRLLKEQRARKAAASKPVKASRSTPTSSRIEKVKVKVEPQKKLPAGKTQKALPPGKKGGAVTTGKGRSGVSARRAQAAGKAERARRGTTGKGVRKGQPAGAANRVYGAKRVSAAVKRAQANQLQGTRVGGPSKKSGLGAAVIGQLADKLLGPVVKNVGYEAGKAIRNALGGGEPTLDKNGKKIKPKSAPAKTPKSNNAAEINAKLKKERAEREKAKSRSGGNANSQILRSAPANNKPAPKPAPTRKPAPKPAPTRKPAPTKSTPARKATPKAATGADAQNIRSGPSPLKATKSTKPTKKVYGSTGRKDLKQSSRMAAALKDLKIRKYKK